jgi:hypothetical protein
MWRAMSAAAIFHASGPSDASGTTQYATTVPTVVPTAPANHGPDVSVLFCLTV